MASSAISGVGVAVVFLATFALVERFVVFFVPFFDVAISVAPHIGRPRPFKRCFRGILSAAVGQKAARKFPSQQQIRRAD